MEPVKETIKIKKPRVTSKFNQKTENRINGVLT